MSPPCSLIKREADLGERESGQRYVEIKFDQRLQVDRKRFGIPAALGASLLPART